MAAAVETDLDFYGPFLTADQIAFKPAEIIPESPQLLLGDFLLQVAGVEAVRPSRHSRFILNALLSQSAGLLEGFEIFELGFQGASKNAKEVARSQAVKQLIICMNMDGKSRIERIPRGFRGTQFKLSPYLIVERVEDSDLAVPASSHRDSLASVPSELLKGLRPAKFEYRRTVKDKSEEEVIAVYDDRIIIGKHLIYLDGTIKNRCIWELISILLVHKSEKLTSKDIVRLGFASDMPDNDERLKRLANTLTELKRHFFTFGFNEHTLIQRGNVDKPNPNGRIWYGIGVKIADVSALPKSHGKFVTYAQNDQAAASKQKNSLSPDLQAQDRLHTNHRAVKSATQRHATLPPASGETEAQAIIKASDELKLSIKRGGEFPSTQIAKLGVERSKRALRIVFDEITDAEAQARFAHVSEVLASMQKHIEEGSEAIDSSPYSRSFRRSIGTA